MRPVCPQCSRAAGTLAPGPSTRSLESCGGCSGVTHSSSTASRWVPPPSSGPLPVGGKVPRPDPSTPAAASPSYRLASDVRPCARRCTARCSTPPRTTAPCASGTCAGSEVPRGPLRPRAASHASSATRWAAPPHPCSRPDHAGRDSPDAHRLPERPALLPAAVAPDGRGGARKPGRKESPAQASGFSLVARRRWERECSPSGPPSFPF